MPIGKIKKYKTAQSLQSAINQLNAASKEVKAAGAKTKKKGALTQGYRGKKYYAANLKKKKAERAVRAAEKRENTKRSSAKRYQNQK